MNKGSSTEYFATVSADFMNKALPTFVHGECISVHFPAGAIRNRLHCRPTQNLTTFGIGKTYFAPNASKSTLTKKRERFMKLHRPVPLVFCTCHKTLGKSIRRCASPLSLSIQPKVPHPAHQRPRGRRENTREVDTGAGTSASAQMNSQLM